MLACDDTRWNYAEFNLFAPVSDSDWQRAKYRPATGVDGKHRGSHRTLPNAPDGIQGPKRVVIVDRSPKSPSSKVLKRDLRKAHAELLQGDTPD